MSGTGSWVGRLRPVAPIDELEYACLPETWNRTVAAIGINAASWAVEFCQELAGLAVDPAIPTIFTTRREELRPTAEAVVMGALVALYNDEPAPTTIPQETSRQLSRAIRQRTPLERILTFQRSSHARFSEVLVAKFRELVPADEQAEGFVDLSRFLVDLVSSFSLACSSAFIAEEQAWLASFEGSRGEVVRALLNGEHLDADVARALRYELANRTHVGLVLRRVGRDDEPADTLVKTATGLLTRIGATAHLVVPAGAQEAWAWGSVVDPRSTDLRAMPAVPDTLVAVGRPAAGLEGFRATHTEAAAVARVVMFSKRDHARTVFFDDVRLATLLTADPHSAEQFVREELGPLAHPREGVLRETVRVYLECNCSPASTAARVNVVKNTVVYRIRRAEELLGRSVKDRQGMLWAALHLVDVVDPAESQYET